MNLLQIRDMLLGLTDEAEGVFDDGTAAEDLWIDRTGFGELHQLLLRTAKKLKRGRAAKASAGAWGA